jgi:hypothetical protein
MAVDKVQDTLYAPFDNTIITVSIPEVKLYTDSVILSASIAPVPTGGTITFEYPSGNTMTTYPDSRPVKMLINGSVPNGTYMATIYATGPNGTPAHKRTVTIKVLQGFVFMATASASPATLCQGLTSQLNASVIGGTPPLTYSWTPATGLNNANIQNPVATPVQTTWYKVTVYDNASHITTDSVKVTVNMPPATPGPIAGMQAVCNGDTAEYSVVDVAGSTGYSWTVPADATILSGQNTPSISLLWGSTSDTIIVIARNDCGTSIQSVLPVVVNTPPSTPTAITGNDVVCINTQGSFATTYSGSSVNFTWTVPADATITSGQGTSAITVMWGSAAGNVEVVVSNDCGTSPVVSKSVTVNTIPEPAGVVAGNDTVCLGQGNYIYSIPAVTGATGYVWTLPAGITVSAGQGTNQVTLTMGNDAQSGNVIVKGTNNCGTGTESAKAIMVKNCTGIGQNNLTSAVKIYPNPVKDELTININGNEKSLDLTITDMNGKILLSEKLNISGSEFRKQLDMSGFAQGIYFIRLTSGERSYSEKVVVQ